MPMNKLCRTYIRKVKLLFPVMGKYERKYIKLLLILLTICLLSLTIMKIYIQYEGHKVFMEEQIHSEETIIE